MTHPIDTFFALLPGVRKAVDAAFLPDSSPYQGA